MKIEVLKLGGSCLDGVKGFELATKIVTEKTKPYRPVCVVSAMKGVTDRLIDIVNRTYREDYFDFKRQVRELYEIHKITASGIRNSSTRKIGENVGEFNEELYSEYQSLQNALSYMKDSRELDSTYAYIISRGENLSGLIFSLYLNVNGTPAKFFRGEDVVVTDENNRDAMIDLEMTKDRVNKLLLPSLESGKVPVVAGFAGRSRSGKNTILGRGGSDDTAVALGYCLGSKRVVKYTDEDGIMTVNPKFVKEVKDYYPEVVNKIGQLPEPGVIPYLSYVEASELLREERTKIVHFKVLDALMKGGINLQIKNISKPESGGTIIGPEEENARLSLIKAISFQRELSCIKFLPTQSVNPIDVYAKIFPILSDSGVDVRYLSTSGYQISLLVPEEDLEKAVFALKASDVTLDVAPEEGRKGTISIIGSGMRGKKGTFARITDTIARYDINIEQAVQPNSENIIRFSIKDEDVPLAVCALYNEFFKKGE